MPEEDVNSRIKDLLRCPVDWREVTGLPHRQHQWLLFDWYSCLLETAVSVDEEAAIHQIAEHGEILYGKYDAHTVANIGLRLDETKSLFAHRSHKLSRLQFLAPSHDGKHFKPHLTRDEILTYSRDGPSLFFENHNANDMRRAFWIWFDFFFDTWLTLDQFHAQDIEAPRQIALPGLFDIWNKFMKEPQFRVAVSCIKKIGAVAGYPSRHLCFDVGIAAGIVHAYPVSPDEAEKIMIPSYVAGAELLEEHG